MTSLEGYTPVLTDTEPTKPTTKPSAVVAVDVATMVEMYSRLLFRVAHSVLLSPAEAEDVVQDAFVRVLEHRDRLPELRDERVWLVRIAWNLALDRRRRIRPEQMDAGSLSGLAGRGTPADVALGASERVAAVLREIDRLPRPERHVMLLSAIEELSTQEMAAVLGKGEPAVRALLSRARARLRERLATQENAGRRTG